MCSPPQPGIQSSHFSHAQNWGHTMDYSRRRLIWHGMFLFLLGLLTGFVETKFANPRMGLAAHLEGVMNGTFLIALGAAWVEVRLSAKLKATAYWTALYGAYVNWATTALGAALGAAALSPITGAGHNALPWQETLMTALFMSVGLAIVGSSVLVLWGLRRNAAAALAPPSTTEANKAPGT
jgi:hydroxylaminobenzene mutase